MKNNTFVNGHAKPETLKQHSDTNVCATKRLNPKSTNIWYGSLQGTLYFHKFVFIDLMFSGI